MLILKKILNFLKKKLNEKNLNSIKTKSLNPKESKQLNSEETPADLSILNREPLLYNPCNFDPKVEEDYNYNNNSLLYDPHKQPEDSTSNVREVPMEENREDIKNPKPSPELIKLWESQINSKNSAINR